MKALPSAGTARGELLAIPGNVPELIDPPKMCRFSSRCAVAVDKCKKMILNLKLSQDRTL